MVFKDAGSKEILHYSIVNYETNDDYRRWVYYLIAKWREIKAIVCDWRRWLLWWFEWISTQMCHFHQKQIIRRYITKTPKLLANKELQEVVKWLPRTDKYSFEMALLRRHTKHRAFIEEKWINSEWKTYYIHRRTRSAYWSLRRNMQYLFVYMDHLKTLEIPNTTNGIESVFSHLKYKVTLHRWLRQDRQLKLINYLLYSSK